MKHFFLFASIALIIAGCSAATPTPLPTYTPPPTYTPYPTFTPPASAASSASSLSARPLSTATPKPTTAPQSTVPVASCISWKEATAHLNETTCVTGIVSSTNLSGSTFFIDFDNTRASFYSVSFKYTWDGLKGKCVEIIGKIVPYNGRPQIVIDKQEQLRECLNKP